jgi:uncharacterized protein YoxC
VATEQEILNLIYQYQGADALKQAKQDLEDARTATAALGDQFRQGAIDEATFREAIRFQARAIADSRERIEGFERAARGGASGMAGFGQSTLQAGRIVQDFTQGGLAGVLNNIEGLTMALGGPAGLAGILTIVGVGFYVLKPKIEELMKSLLDDAPVTFADRLEELHKRIKELEDKPHKIAVEVDELRDAKEQVEAIEAGLKTIEQMRKTQAYYEKAAGAQIAETFAEAPGGAAAVAGTVQEQIRRQVAEATPELAPGQARIADLGREIEAFRRSLERQQAVGALTPEGREAIEGQIQALGQERDRLTARVNTLEQDIDRRAGAEAGMLINRAQQGTGVEQMQAQRELAARLAAGGQRDLAQAVQLSAPGIIQTQEEIDETLEARNAQAKQVREAQQKRARDAAQAEKRRGDEAERINREAARAAGLQQQDREKADREAQRAQDERAREAKQDIDQLMRGVEPTSIGERAAAESARLRLPQMDQFGRTYRLTGQQQQLSLRNQIRAELQQAFPGLTRPQLAGLTGRVAEQAETQAGRVQGQQRAAIMQQARATGQTLRAGELNVMATQRTLMLLQGLIPRVEAVEQAAMANLRRAEQMQARTKPAARRAR